MYYDPYSDDRNAFETGRSIVLEPNVHAADSTQVDYHSTKQKNNAPRPSRTVADSDRSTFKGTEDIGPDITVSTGTIHEKTALPEAKRSDVTKDDESRPWHKQWADCIYRPLYVKGSHKPGSLTSPSNDRQTAGGALESETQATEPDQSIGDRSTTYPEQSPSKLTAAEEHRGAEIKDGHPSFLANMRRRSSEIRRKLSGLLA
jgi:hypothetical protein